MIFILTTIIISIGLGLLLSYIAFDELEELKNKLFYCKRLVILLITLFIIYNLLIIKEIMLIPLVILFLTSFFLEVKEKLLNKGIKYELIYYIISIISYFVIKNNNLANSQILLVLILIYGIFIGSILHLKFLHQINKKHT